MLRSPPAGCPAAAPPPTRWTSARRAGSCCTAASSLLSGGRSSEHAQRPQVGPGRGGGARGCIPIIIARAALARRLFCLAVRVVILCALASTSQMPWSSPAPLGVGTRPAGGLIHQAAPRPAAHVLYGVCGCSCASPLDPGANYFFRGTPFTLAVHRCLQQFPLTSIQPRPFPTTQPTPHPPPSLRPRRGSCSLLPLPPQVPPVLFFPKAVNTSFCSQRLLALPASPFPCCPLSSALLLLACALFACVYAPFMTLDATAAHDMM